MIDINVNPEQNPSLIGERPATEEEQKTLNSVMDTIEQAIHGEFRDDIVKTLDSHPDLWKSTSQLATMIVSRTAHKLDEEQIPHDSSVFFGQNGAVQQTVEMLWEVGDAMNHPAAQDDDQFEASYLATLENLGEFLEEDPESSKEAQAFLLQQELGEDVVDLAASDIEQQTQEMQLAQNDVEEDPSLWDVTKVRTKHLIENIGEFIPSIGPSRDSREESKRRSAKGVGNREIQVRDELDPNATMRRRMIEAGLEEDG